MVVWSPLSGISFSALADAEGQRRGLNAHLQALRATGLLRVLQQCMIKYFERLPSGNESKNKRRRVNEEVKELNKAIEHIDAPGGNALGQSAAPMQPLASTAAELTPFHEALASSNVRPQLAPLLPGDLVGAQLAVSLARVALAASSGRRIARSARSSSGMSCPICRCRLSPSHSCIC